jgi:O-antigen/teichoic acid export membrane protein
MSRTRRYLGGLAANYVNQAVTLGLGLWLTRFLLHRLGQEEYGLWLIVFQALTFLELTDLGVIALVPREVAYRTGLASGQQGDTALLRPLLDEVRRITLWQLPLVAGVAAGFWGLLLGGRLEDPATLPLAVAALAYVLLFPLRMYAATLQGLQDLTFLGVASTGVWLAQAVVTVALIVGGFGFWSLVLGWASGRCLHTAVCWLRLRAAFPEALPPHRLGRQTEHTGRLVRSGLWISLGNLALSLHYGADVLILGQILGPAPVVVYACTMRLITLCTFQVTGVATVAGPALSELRESGSHGALLRASAALGQLTLLTSGLVACVLLIGNEGFVTWWVGAGQYGGSLLTSLLLAAMLLRHLAFTFAHILMCLGKEKPLALIILGDGMVIVAATALLAPALGLLAAPVGSLLGVSLVSLPLFAALLVRQCNFSLASLLTAYLPWVWRFALLATGLGWLSGVWIPSGLLQVGLTAAAVAALYAGVMLTGVVHTPLWAYLQPRLAALRARFRPASAPAAPLPLGPAQGEALVSGPPQVSS